MNRRTFIAMSTIGALGLAWRATCVGRYAGPACIQVRRKPARHLGRRSRRHRVRSQELQDRSADASRDVAARSRGIGRGRARSLSPGRGIRLHHRRSRITWNHVGQRDSRIRRRRAFPRAGVSSRRQPRGHRSRACRARRSVGRRRLRTLDGSRLRQHLQPPDGVLRRA